ncbi:hypothetical protein [Microvirga rosea]|uniref:hypothetical protein n=1 Tax=Microvirga rosea TaxID=2715425 RepID=UPI001D0A0AD3|nr:hypothetical protein [Microvirga rosea]MCB8823207.1 hypothetical protein [Microvirga rosea]
MLRSALLISLLAAPAASLAQSAKIVVFDSACIARKTNECALEMKKPQHKRSAQSTCPGDSEAANDGLCYFHPVAVFSMCEAKAKAEFDKGENCAREINIEAKVDALTKLMRDDFVAALREILAEAKGEDR